MKNIKVIPIEIKTFLIFITFSKEINADKSKVKTRISKLNSIINEIL